MAKRIMRFLKEYEYVSREKVNAGRSGFVLASKAPLIRYTMIHHMTGFKIQSILIKYLGVQLYKGHNKMLMFEGLVCRI